MKLCEELGSTETDECRKMVEIICLDIIRASFPHLLFLLNFLRISFLSFDELHENMKPPL